MSKDRISRKKFLKLLGGSGLFFFMTGLGAFTLIHSRKESSSPPMSAFAQAAGSWIQGPNTTTVAIHAALLPNGSIFYMAGSGYHRSHLTGPYEARLLMNADVGTETDVSMAEDLWCAGHTHLPDGKVLLAGGTLLYDTAPNNCNGEWHGLKATYEFGSTPGLLVPVGSMAAGRWYPTLVTLGDGKVAAFIGFDEYGTKNRLVEIYDHVAKSWTIKYDPATSTRYCVGSDAVGTCSGAGSKCFGGTPGKGVSPDLSNYVRMHLMPNGRIVTAGMQTPIRSFNPSTGEWTQLGSMNGYRHYGTSFLLPLSNTASERGKVLVVGGSPSSSTVATKDVRILDFDAGSANAPVIRTVQSARYARKFMMPVILPDGKVALFGGSSQNATDYVNTPEIFDPVEEKWSSLPSSMIGRSYHAVALLLTDGRVWLAGGTPTSNVWELRTEIFRPGYCFSTRPVISGNPTVGAYGNSITIPTSDSSNITSASLVRLMTSTHHYDPNQRMLWLQITSKTSNSVIVNSPLNGNLAPPGFYMIHLLNGANTPSVSKIIKIPGIGTGKAGGDTVPPSQVTGLTINMISSSQVILNWHPNTEVDLNHYNVHRSTSSGFTPSSSNLIAQRTTTSYNNTGLSPSTTYYYKVAAVDNSGNIGSPSIQLSVTTTDVAALFYIVGSPGNGSRALYGGDNTRYGVEARISSSAIVGKSLRKWVVYLRKVGSPSGSVTAVVRRAANDSVAATFDDTISSASLPTIMTPFEFTLANPHSIQAGDRIVVQYSGPNGIEISVWNTDKFDGDRTRRVRYSTSYVGGNSEDIAGTMSS